MVPSSGMLAQLQVDAKAGDETAKAATETASLILLVLMVRLS
jgi:hypothetical protein